MLLLLLLSEIVKAVQTERRLASWMKILLQFTKYISRSGIEPNVVAMDVWSALHRCKRLPCLLLFLLSLWSQCLLLHDLMIGDKNMKDGRYLSSGDFSTTKSSSDNWNKWDDNVDLQFKKSSNLPKWMKGMLQRVALRND
jgi:hypothetical protein